jgi:hypothetical protein
MHAKRSATTSNLAGQLPNRRHIMSAAEAASGPEPLSRSKNLIGFDGILLVVLSALLIVHAGLYYVCLHYNLAWMFVANWIMVDLVDKLALPANVTSAIIENCFMLVVGECFAVILTIRFIMLRTLKSLPSLPCAGLLIAYNFGGANALESAFDQLRFQTNRGAYLAIAKESDGWPNSAVIKWGGGGFLDSSIQYFLVFDRAGVTASGAVAPEELVSKGEHMKCDGRVRRLSSDFHSVSVWCVGT